MFWVSIWIWRKFWNIIYKTPTVAGTPLVFVIFPKITVSFLRFWIPNEIPDLQCKTKWISSFSPQVTFERYLCHRSKTFVSQLWKLARLTAEENQNWDHQAGWMYGWRGSRGHFHIASLIAFPWFLALVLVFFLNISLNESLILCLWFCTHEEKKIQNIWGFNQSLVGIEASVTMPWLLYLNQLFCTNIRYWNYLQEEDSILWISQLQYFRWICAWLYDIISILFSSKTLRAVTGWEPVEKR